MKPDYAFWDGVDEFSLGDAASLWLDMEPGSEPGREREIGAMRRVLQPCFRTERTERTPGRFPFPRFQWPATRSVLRVFAHKRRESPPFLFPESRTVTATVRKDALSHSIDVALAVLHSELHRRPTEAELFHHLANCGDGTVIDVTNEKLVWVDAGGKEHVTNRRALKKRFSRTKPR